MSDMKEFFKDFVFGYAVSYIATTLVEENQKRTAESQGVQTFDDQFKNEMCKFGKAMGKTDSDQ